MRAKIDETAALFHQVSSTAENITTDFHLLLITNSKNLIVDVAYLEGKGLISKPQILSGHKPSQKDIDSLSYGERQSHHTIGSGLPVKAADKIRQIIQHTQVVLHDDNIAAQAVYLINTPFNSVCSITVKRTATSGKHSTAKGINDRNRHFISIS